MRALARALPRLACLQLHWCEHLTDASLAHLHAAAGALTELNISYNRRLSSEAIAQLCVDMQLKQPPLRVLECQFTHLDPVEGVAFVKQHAPELKLRS